MTADSTDDWRINLAEIVATFSMVHSKALNACGQDWVNCYLGGCKTNLGENTLIARNGFARKEIKRKLSRILSVEKVKVICRDKPSTDSQGLELWSEQRIKVANMLICCAIGRRSVNEGWIIALHDYCREYLRLPSVQETNRMQSLSASIDADLRVMNVPRGLVEARNARRRNLEKLVIGETKSNTPV